MSFLWENELRARLTITQAELETARSTNSKLVQKLDAANRRITSLMRLTRPRVDVRRAIVKAANVDHGVEGNRTMQALAKKDREIDALKRELARFKTVPIARAAT